MPTMKTQRNVQANAREIRVMESPSPERGEIYRRNGCRLVKNGAFALDCTLTRGGHAQAQAPSGERCAPSGDRPRLRHAVVDPLRELLDAGRRERAARRHAV